MNNKQNSNLGMEDEPDELLQAMNDYMDNGLNPLPDVWKHFTNRTGRNNKSVIPYINELVLSCMFYLHECDQTSDKSTFAT